ncbi:MAG: DUF1802 family protein [Richelia sp. RM2_1_2]|nr:DUF1802 family protein [Richelia sp. SM2_1_7]NJM18346.1 DUF1802 family protein [Richelia sp. SM1_7_0]NJN10227.1 DUF1802 family protein [Richelia sp. RM1_1_1]NJO28637.1 DUF1802 family protein [Richelia sp. SL_2_1]NJO56962.1 DUF1802 family protein [Richelia sp. RM2_1_2]
MEQTTNHALKEWSIAINALESGETIMLLRKGGIHEKGGRFRVAHHQVLLYPTYEHQQTFMLKADYSNLVIPVTSGWRPQGVKITSYAQITHILPVTDDSIINALLPFHIWNQHFIHDRQDWKPLEPLFVLLLRTYKLPTPQLVAYHPHYGGCKSWIDLHESISLAAATPAIPENTYSELVAQICQITGDSSYISPNK